MKKTTVLFLCICMLTAALSGCEAGTMSAEDLLLLYTDGTAQEVEAAIKRGADVNAKDENGSTPLMAAVFNDDTEVLSVLINAGADVNAKSSEGWTALMYVARYRGGDPEILKILIKGGADVNVKNNAGWTALMSAAWYSYDPVTFNVLIEAGADVNAKNSAGRTVLNLTVEANVPEAVSLLLKAGAAVSENDVQLAQDNENLKGTAVIEELKRKLM